MIPNGRAALFGAISLLMELGAAPAALAETPSFPTLVEEALGTSARPVRFDWRKRRILLDFSVGMPVELNNFESSRFAASAAFPGVDVTPFLGLGYTNTESTPSSEAIARTPYRQVGRPSRLELEGGALYPLAEGIVTLRPSLLPAAEFVVLGKATLRYLSYPGALKGKDFGGALSALVSPQLTTSEVEQLRQTAPGGMTIDKARLNLLAGGSLILFSASGLSLAPSVQIGLPWLGSSLGFSWDVALGLGYAL